MLSYDAGEIRTMQYSPKQTPNAFQAAIVAATLQEHRAYHSRLTITKLSNRAFCLVIIGALVFPQDVSDTLAVSAVLITGLITLLWRFELRTLTRRIDVIERFFAEQSGEVLEDGWIRAGYERFGTQYEKYSPITILIARRESEIWFLIVLGLAIFRMSYRLFV